MNSKQGLGVHGGNGRNQKVENEISVGPWQLKDHQNMPTMLFATNGSSTNDSSVRGVKGLARKFWAKPNASLKGCTKATERIFRKTARMCIPVFLLQADAA